MKEESMIETPKAEIEPVNPYEKNLDIILCNTSKRYGIPRLLLKAIATVESSLNPKAYRYEPLFWEKYLKNNPEWSNRKPEIVSASYGLFQIMFTTAWALGFRIEPDEKMAEELYNPVYNAELAAKLLTRIYDKAIKQEKLDIKYALNPWAICTARYNGGTTGNPSDDGLLRNQPYVYKVFKTWYGLLLKEEVECNE